MMPWIYYLEMLHMREIKFRIWDAENKIIKHIMCFYSDEQIEYRNGMAIIALNKKRGDDFVLMQYTGVKDKYGKEIYEGDIVRYNDRQIGVIVWEHTSFVLKLLNDKKNTIILWYDVDTKDNIEVIGNIYENPELLVLLSDEC